MPEKILIFALHTLDTLSITLAANGFGIFKKGVAVRGSCLGFLLVLVGASINIPAFATTYCVGTATELSNALIAAAASDVDDEIRIRAGVYQPSQTLVYNSQNTGWLSVSGGYYTFSDNPCGGRNPDARVTVLDGSGLRQIMIINLISPTIVGPFTRFLVSNLTLQNGIHSAQFGRGGGMQIYSNINSFDVEYWLDNLIVRNNRGYFAGGIDLSLKRGLVRVVNSLFDANSAPTSAFGHLAVLIAEASAGNGSGAILLNNTFTGGQCAGDGGRGCGIGLVLCNGVRADVINSMFFNNAISDVNAEGCASTGQGNGSVHYSHSRITGTSGNLTPLATSPYSADPRFVNPAAGNFELRNDSFYLNKGLGVPPWYGEYTSQQDVYGRPRIKTGKLDVGALENQTGLFYDGFE